MTELYLKSFEKLNEFQRDAVTSRDRYALLNASVGSGKTTVLVHKVLYENIIGNISLDNIMILTFTNRAAEEIKKRIRTFEDDLKGEFKYCGTFHSVARRILAESPNLKNIGYDENFQVIDNEEAGEILDRVIENSRLKIKYRAKLIKRIEEFKMGKSLYGVMKREDDIDKLFELYREEKLKRNLMDFDDIIENCTRILDSPINPKLIIIDEFQDTDLRQLDMIKSIAGKDTRIFSIGDPNQIIYSFRNGNVNIFNRFKSLYNPVEFTLPINYRSSKTIIEAANAILGKGYIKGIRNDENPIIVKKHYDAFNEALHIANKVKELSLQGVPYEDIAVMFRRLVQGDIICDVFKKNNIPYNRASKENNKEENVENVDKKGVSVITMHSSKGLEFSHVFIIGVNMGNIPLTIKRSDEEEEIRLFFVAVTRAKKYLEISYLIKPDIPGVTKFISPYISMIPQHLILKEDKSENITLKDIVISLREEREKRQTQGQKRAVHRKYGEGRVTFEDDNIIRVEFEGYGEKEFSKLFCPLEII